MITVELSEMFYEMTGTRPDSIVQLPGSGSARVYYRISAANNHVIGAFNDDIRENMAFFYLTNHFLNHQLPVPEVLKISNDRKKYFLTDLGDITLYSLIRPDSPVTTDSDDSVLQKYIEAIILLPEFQIKASEDLDFSPCYPVGSFDLTSMKWDLNYFKYYFLRLSRIPFNENLLEVDFNNLCDHLLKAGMSHFMYRDFQSRNIMIHQNKPYFIDYQGGRRGSLQYDLASLLYDAKANLSPRLRKMLLQVYLEHATKSYHIDQEQFMIFYPAFVLIRILQALGAYGLRGYFERKSHFLKSIPYAIENLRLLFENGFTQPELPEISRIVNQMTDKSGKFYKKLIDLSQPHDFEVKDQQPGATLTIRINSFSYRRAIPEDSTGNGGGFVFDCRALPNPGRFEEYKNKTGKDKEVIDFLKDEPEVMTFLQNAEQIVDSSIRNYLHRGFTGLMVSFGCTGGKHRSVYCAERLAERLRNVPLVKVVVSHIEQDFR